MPGLTTDNGRPWLVSITRGQCGPTVEFDELGRVASLCVWSFSLWALIRKSSFGFRHVCSAVYVWKESRPRRDDCLSRQPAGDIGWVKRFLENGVGLKGHDFGQGGRIIHAGGHRNVRGKLAAADMAEDFDAFAVGKHEIEQDAMKAEGQFLESFRNR